jgi:hypothetical protein
LSTSRSRGNKPWQSTVLAVPNGVAAAEGVLVNAPKLDAPRQRRLVQRAAGGQGIGPVGAVGTEREALLPGSLGQLHQPGVCGLDAVQPQGITRIATRVMLRGDGGDRTSGRFDLILTFLDLALGCDVTGRGLSARCLATCCRGRVADGPAPSMPNA